MNDLEKAAFNGSMQNENLYRVKQDVNDLIHNSIHVLHDKSLSLADVNPDNDLECLRSITSELNALINFMRVRYALDGKNVL